jgi:hypothetical protein
MSGKKVKQDLQTIFFSLQNQKEIHGAEQIG